MTETKKLQVSEFDIELFRKLSQYYITSKMIYQLLPTFGKKASIKSFSMLQGRLRKLYQAGYINRDQRLSRGQGVNEYYYFLTKRGANFFEDLQHIKPAHGILKRLELGSQEHAFMISEFMVKLEKDIWQSRPRIEMKGYIRENYFEIKIPKQKREERDRYLKPDATIFIQDNDQNYLFFVEVDLSTQPVFASNPYRSSFRKKIEIYSGFKSSFKHHPLIKLFGQFTGYRVLTICRSPERVASLIDAAQRMGKKRMFYFTHLEKIKRENIFFSPIWSLPNGTTSSLFD